MDTDEKKCPYCAEAIKETATICRHCKHELTVPPIGAVSTQSYHEQAQYAYMEPAPHQTAPAIQPTINVIMAAAPQSNKSDKSRGVAILLCLFLGGIGIHRFYVRKNGTGLIQILTLGGLGIWVLIDLILLLAGAFTDKDGKPLM